MSWVKELRLMLGKLLDELAGCSPIWSSSLELSTSTEARNPTMSLARLEGNVGATVHHVEIRSSYRRPAKICSRNFFFFFIPTSRDEVD